MEYGKPNHNFSHRSGFYVGDNLSKIVSFLSEKFSDQEKIGVLCFAYEDNSENDPFKKFLPHEGLDLRPTSQVKVIFGIKTYKK